MEKLWDFEGTHTGFNFGKKQMLCLLLALAVFIVFSLLPLGGTGLSPEGQRALAILGFILTLWITNAIPSVTASFLFLILTVFFKLATINQLLADMGTSPLFMVMALLVVAEGMTNTTFAERITFWLISKLGSSPSKILLAMIVGTMFMSMFIADIPAALMMLVIANGILKEMHEKPGESRFGRALMLGICMASFVGGLGLISGSGINMMGLSVLEKATKGAITINYLQWAAIGVPFVMLMIIPTWLAYNFAFQVNKRPENAIILDKEVFVKKLRDLGPLNAAEKRFILILAIMMALFITSTWTKLAVAFIAIIAMVISILPVIGVVNWDKVKKGLPWDMLFMIATATAFAGVISSTGLGLWIVKILLGWAMGYSLFGLIFVTCLVGVLVHLVIMGAASAAVAVLVAAVIALAGSTGINPAILVIPAIFTGSASTLMPIDPGFLISYHYGYWKLQDFFLPGAIVSVFWIIFLAIVTYFVAPLVGLM